MRIIRRLARCDAENLLCKYGSRNKAEEKWTKDHSKYLVGSGRIYFTEVRLNKIEFMNLVFNGEPDIKKASDLEGKIKNLGFEKNSYLFLRDLNEKEDGSFYVENGIHRTAAYKNLITRGVKYKLVSAVLFSKDYLLTPSEYYKH